MAIEDWSEEEKQFVLNFYSLSELQPTEYSETSANGFDFGGLSFSIGEQSEGSGIDSLSVARTLLQQDKDPLGINDANYRKEAKNNPNQLLSTVSTFSPKTFLSRVHAESSTQELLKGRDNLAKEIETRDSTVKEMVRQNFARFVNAKNSIDIVYGDMREKGISDPSNRTFGTQTALDHVTEAYKQAQKIFQPLIKRTEEEADMKRRLDFLRKFKSSVFIVGKKLREACQSGDFTTAIHDFRRGKTAMSDLSGTSVAEQDALLKYWTGQVEPEVSKLKQAIKTLLVGAEAGWGQSFEDFHKFILLFKVLDPPSDPMRLWYADYTQRLLDELDKYHLFAIEAQQNTISSWKDELSGSIEGGLVRSVLSYVSNDHGFSSPLRLDFICSSLWKDRQVFFEGAGLLISRILSILEESEEIEESFCKQFVSKLVKFTEDILESTSIESSVVSFFGARQAILALCTSLQRHANTGTIYRPLADECVRSVSKILIRNAWAIAPLECRRVTRWQDWSIDSSDYSTAVMRALERLLVYYIDSSSVVYECIKKVTCNVD